MKSDGQPWHQYNGNFFISDDVKTKDKIHCIILSTIEEYSLSPMSLDCFDYYEFQMSLRLQFE